jgi:phosphatidylserine/phosphatidylglycerophosphate/cardiolipin synthase-like enzyme
MIKIHTYALSDEAVMGVLLKKQPSLSNIEIITDSKTILSPYHLLQTELSWKGIKSSGLMHEKILILDDTTTFLGTANMTYESLSMHDNLMIGFYHPPLADYLTRYTQEIELKKKHKNLSSQTFVIDDQTVDLWLLPYKGTAPLERLKQLIYQAKHSLQIAMFTLTHNELIDAIIEAHHRGVKVQVFLDSTSAKGASANSVSRFLEAHIPLYLSEGLQLLHYKMMVVDDTYFVLGSANWTKSAFKKNHDFYLVLSPLHRDQIHILHKIFHKISLEASES